MDPDGCYRMLFFIILLLISALIAGVEAALSSLNRYRLRHLAAGSDPKARQLCMLLEEPVKLYDALMIGSTLVLTSAIVLGSSLIINSNQSRMSALSAILIMTVVVIIFAKTIPQVLVSRNSEHVSYIMVKTARVLVCVLSPLVKINRLVAVIVAKLVGVKESPVVGDPAEEEIIGLVAAGQEEGVIHQEEETMIRSVFDFSDRVVRDLMVPRLDIVAVANDVSYTDIMKIINAKKFSRIPVYEGNIDNILGIVHIKDLIAIDSEKQNGFRSGDYLRQTFFVPETKKVNELFKEMKKEKIHLAVVLDEYGSTAGLVTMEDLIEEILGDIQDEHDVEEPSLIRIDKQTDEIDAGLRIDELNEMLGLNLECKEADTIGGLVFAELGRVPVVGDSLRVNGVKLVVQLMEGHRIAKLRLKKPAL